MRKYKFKVVKKENNRSCIINGNSAFCLTYDKDTNVYALEGTLGIMVFKTRTEAENWIEGRFGEEYWIIKRVIPIGKGKTPKEISISVASEDLRGFYRDFWRRTQTPVSGTICYPGVYVID